MRLAALVLFALTVHAQQPDFYKGLKNGPVYSNSYIFQIGSASVISGSLATTGAKTLTIKQTAPGVYGASTNHYLRVSGGVGTAETVLITGGTCSAALTTNCTLQFTTANTHSGSWIISSATAGITEAHRAIPETTSIYIGPGSYTIYAKTTFISSMALIGAGDKATFFTLADPAMDVFMGTAWLNAVGMNISSGSAYQTAGSVFKLSGGTIQVQNIYTNYIYIGVESQAISASDCWFAGTVRHALYKPTTSPAGIFRVSNVYADGRYYNGGVGLVTSTTNIAGAVVTRTGGGSFTPLRAGGLMRIAGALYTIQSVDTGDQITLTGSPSPGTGITTEAYSELLAPALIQVNGLVGGATFTNLWFQASQISMNFTSFTSLPTNETVIGDCIFDHDTINVAAVAMSNSDLDINSSSNSIRINNAYINSSGYGVLSQYVNNVSISNSYIRAYTGFPGIASTASTNLSAIDNQILLPGTGTTAIVVGTGSNGFTARGNNFVLAQAGAVGITAATSGLTSMSVSGNTVYGGTALFGTTPAAANVFARGNFSPEARKQVAVTGTETLVIPAADESTLINIIGGGTGSTVATINGGYNGRTIQIYLSTNITFAATANILTALSGTSGMYLQATYDGSLAKWLIK